MRRLASSSNSATRGLSVFSLTDCLGNSKQYVDGKTNASRPRLGMDRPEQDQVLAALANEPARILFGDAIGVFEAAQLLGVHPTLVPRMIRAGKVIGRLLFNGREGTRASRALILSRTSCIADRAEYIRRLGAGEKMPGRPRRLAATIRVDIGDARPEGRLRTHRTRERNRVLVKQKKQSVLGSQGSLRCEACGGNLHTQSRGQPSWS